MNKVAISIVCIGSLAWAACATRRGILLDATEIDVRPEPGHTIEMGTVTSERRPASPFPLAIRIVKMDHREYRRMDRVKYDVAITNVSAHPVTFPWSPVPINRGDRPPSGYRHASFEFIVMKQGQRDGVAHTFVLYGAPTVVGSLKEVRPAETVVVRLPGVFSGSGFQDIRNPILCPDGSLKVKIGLSVYSAEDEPFKFFHEEFSRNTLPIRIAGGPDPNCVRPPDIGQQRPAG